LQQSYYILIAGFKHVWLSTDISAARYLLQSFCLCVIRVLVSFIASRPNPRSFSCRGSLSCYCAASNYQIVLMQPLLYCCPASLPDLVGSPSVQGTSHAALWLSDSLRFTSLSCRWCWLAWTYFLAGLIMQPLLRCFAILVSSLFASPSVQGATVCSLVASRLLKNAALNSHGLILQQTHVDPHLQPAASQKALESMEVADVVRCERDAETGRCVSWLLEDATLSSLPCFFSTRMMTPIYSLQHHTTILCGSFLVMRCHWEHGLQLYGLGYCSWG